MIVLRHVLSGIAEEVSEVAHVVNGATERVDIIVRGVGIRWLQILFGFGVGTSCCHPSNLYLVSAS
jgi:hypothetical protein